MSLKNCPECNFLVSSKAESCPNCGYQLKKKSSIGYGTGCLLMIITFFVVFYGIIALNDKESLPSSLRNIGNRSDELATWVKESLSDEIAKDSDYAGIKIGEVSLVKKSQSQYIGLVEYKLGLETEKTDVDVTIDANGRVYTCQPPRKLLMQKILGKLDSLQTFQQDSDTVQKINVAAEEARVVTTKAILRTLHQGILLFKMDTGRYPTEEEGLNALIERPKDAKGWCRYLEESEIPQDAWKHDFVYRLNPQNGIPFVIISYGADGKEGGKGYDATLYSTDADY